MCPIMHQLAWIMMNVVMVNTIVARTESVRTHSDHIHVDVILDFLVTVLNASTRTNVLEIAMHATPSPTATTPR